MSGQHLSTMGHRRTQSRGSLKDFTVATPEEFVKRFGGNKVINKVNGGGGGGGGLLILSWANAAQPIHSLYQVVVEFWVSDS